MSKITRISFFIVLLTISGMTSAGVIEEKIYLMCWFDGFKKLQLGINKEEEVVFDSDKIRVTHNKIKSTQGVIGSSEPYWVNAVDDYGRITATNYHYGLGQNGFAQIKTSIRSPVEKIEGNTKFKATMVGVDNYSYHEVSLFSGFCHVYNRDVYTERFGRHFHAFKTPNESFLINEWREFKNYKR